MAPAGADPRAGRRRTRSQQPPGPRRRPVVAARSDGSRRQESEVPQRLLRGLRPEELHPRLGCAGVLTVLDDPDRVRRDHVEPVGDLHATHGALGRLHVRDVDDAGVRLAQRHLAHGRLGVLLRGRGVDGDARLRERLRRVLPARHLIGAEHHDQPRLREVGEALHLLRIALLDHDLEPVPGERNRRQRDVARVDGFLEVGLVGGREHVGGRTLTDLRCEVRGRVEVELHRHVRVALLELLGDRAEGLGQRRRCEDGDLARRLLARTRRLRGHQERDGRERRQRASHRPPGTSITTLVALTAATARSPGARPSSSAASLVISETTRCGPAWISTCAATLSLTTRVTIPRNRLRADWPTIAPGSGALACPAASSASAAPSTTRCPPPVRRVGRRPSSPQRRTVSRLTPSSSAACPIRSSLTREILRENLGFAVVGQFDLGGMVTWGSGSRVVLTLPECGWELLPHSPHSCCWLYRPVDHGRTLAYRTVGGAVPHKRPAMYLRPPGDGPGASSFSTQIGTSEAWLSTAFAA